MIREQKLARVAPVIMAVGVLGIGAALSGCVGVTADDEGLAQNPAGGAAGALVGAERYIIVMTNPGQARAALARAGAAVELELPGRNAVAARIPAAAVDGLAHNPNIELIELDAVRKPLAESVPYGITAVQADDAVFAGTPTGKMVCIIDSGLGVGHEDLDTTNVTGEAGTAWNEDGCGHGTHVAGTIAAVGGNDAGVVGVMPGGGVRLHIVRVFGDDCGWTYASNLVAAADECAAAGADVINMSLGGGMKSRFEDQAFASLYAAGLLPIAAAGNDGTTRKSYPASYASVISVAAVDDANNIASFSQQNSSVELAAPGVAVLSTLPYVSSVEVAGTTYEASYIEFAAWTSASAVLVDGGRCLAGDSAWSGQVVLCERGDISFFDKVVNVETSGGAAAIIYNNEPGGFAGTLGDGNSSAIGAVTISQEDGQTLLATAIGGTATIASHEVGDGYARWDGTSMATPHVVGVAALVWSQYPSASNADVRAALTSSALDLGPAGRDSAYGYGLVQARAAYDLLGGAAPPPECVADADCGDGNACNGLEICSAGSCVSGAAPMCGLADGCCPGGCSAGSDADCGGGSCSDAGSSCRKGNECCSGVCSGRGANKTCQ